MFHVLLYYVLSCQPSGRSLHDLPPPQLQNPFRLFCACFTKTMSITWATVEKLKMGRFFTCMCSISRMNTCQIQQHFCVCSLQQPHCQPTKACLQILTNETIELTTSMCKTIAYNCCKTAKLRRNPKSSL